MTEEVEKPRKPREGVYTHTVVMVEPNRTSSQNAARVMRISLPMPKGAKFDAMGRDI